MVTATDDIGPRLAAVEANIININTQLAEINANQRQMHAEHQADIRALHARIDQTNDRITQVETRLGAKIDRMLYTIIGFGILTLVGLVGIIGNLALTLIRTA